MNTRIVVPLDGSDVSEQALEMAIAQARAFDLTLHLVRVVDTHVIEQVGGSAAAFNYTMLGEMFELESKEAQTYLDEMTKQLQTDGLSVTSHARVGPIARSIIDELQDGDLVVMGSHGRSGFKRWVLGSIAEEVLRHAHVPVLMVKARDPES